VYASSEEHGKPLLVPYDLFRYMPWSDKILSGSQVAQFARLEISRGWIFIVCSGRNLGPLTIADAFCERFAMSHDMVRISVSPSDESFYVAAFLSTAAGQASLRTDMNGSVIDHTDANQVAAVKYPVIDDDRRKSVATRFRKAFEKRERARLLLSSQQEAFLQHFGLADAESEFTTEQRARRFSVSRSNLLDRIDAEPRAPRYAEWQRRIRTVGGATVREFADVFKPSGRYKTNYVTDAQFGVPMMNGRQISQYQPIALRSMSLAGLKAPKSFRLRTGMTLLTADGRAEENLADCALVAPDRDGWAASGHVHRVTPRDGVHPEVLYLACSCMPAQLQFKSLATGSVVDALSTSDVESVLVPYSDSEPVRRLGEQAQHAWNLFAEAYQDERDAISIIEEALK
jgi:type I restriction enzyme S subunit